MALSRLDLLHAIVSQRTFAIDAYHTNTIDKAFANGHYYSDKAPGTVFLVLPFFYLTSKILLSFDQSLDSEQGWFASSWISVATSIGALAAFGAVCLFLWLEGFIPPRCALICTLVIAFGSMMFPYTTMMLSHSVVIGLFAIALWCLRLGHTPKSAIADRKRFNWSDVIAGASCGLAIACEYSAALVSGGIVAAVLSCSLRRTCQMVLGAIPPLMLIPIYNWICLGNPFALPYGYESHFTQMNKGFYGIHLPELDNAFHLLFSRERGLFFWTPFLLLAVPGYFGLYAISRRLFWLCYFVPLIQVIVMSGNFNMKAGLTLGPRYIAPMLALLILPAGIAARKAPWVAVPLAILSVVITGGATLVTAHLPSGFGNPLFNFYMPEFLAGHFTHNLGELIGLKEHWSVAPPLLLVSLGIWYLWYHLADRNMTGCERRGKSQTFSKA
jgi:hypothetical protein